ncbi:MAG TPA: sulfatase-like hydrolase/transferase [Candidatus Polarisedimenticolaceae bacterium]|nr:sulfatase-like hydrolase/transferase [Candidatus Polarisedimenticolaceae bacterium]
MSRTSLLTLVLVIAASCRSAPPAPPPRDLLLITIDTARADRFSYTGGKVPGTPHVDALAAEGAGFTNAMTPVPLTLPAHASLMTGRLPASHTVRDNGFHRLPDAETTLAEILSGAGRSTAAFIGAEVLDRRYGLDQGFGTYDERFSGGDVPAGLSYYPERDAESVVHAALAWLPGQAGRPVFVWVHLFDPHAPYRPPEPERSRYASGYDGEIAYVDRAIGDLLDGWTKARGLDRTLVVVAGDHGEGLGEHGEKTHGVLVHEATLRVPLVIRVPGARRIAPVGAPVSLIDVLPTVCRLMALPVPPGVQGRDLTPLLSGGSVAWQPTSGYAESLYAFFHHGCTPLFALREKGFKLVRGAADALYDLNEDPREMSDLQASQPEKRASLAASLDRLTAGLDEAAASVAVVPDDETRKTLASLGYASSAPAPAAASRKDPKEALVSLAAMAEADRSALAGDVAAAVTGYRAVLAAEPTSVDARVRLAQILLAANRPKDAVAPLAEAVAVEPADPYLKRKLGNALEASGRVTEALAVYDAGLAEHPVDRDLRTGRWSCLDRLGRTKPMLEESERAVAADPGDGAARLARAMACCGRGTDAEYEAALKRELAALPEDPILLDALRSLKGQK